MLKRQCPHCFHCVALLLIFPATGVEKKSSKTLRKAPTEFGKREVFQLVVLPLVFPTPGTQETSSKALRNAPVSSNFGKGVLAAVDMVWCGKVARGSTFPFHLRRREEIALGRLGAATSLDLSTRRCSFVVPIPAVVHQV